MFVINLIAVVFTSLLCILYCVRNRKAQKTVAPVGFCDDFSMSNRTYNILLAVFFVLAVFLRVFKFGLAPEGVWCDEAMAAVDAKALAEYGTDRFGMWHPVHLTAWEYGQMSALLSYLMVPFIKIFGFSTVVIRIPTLIVSLAGILCLYLFTRSVFNKNVALFVLAFAAINPWHIMQSRWALDCNLYSHFFMIGVYLLYKGIVGKRIYLFVSMAVFGLCMYTYGISIYTMPFFLLAVCIYLLITKKIKLWHAGICVVTYFLVAWPFIAVMAINFFKLETIQTPWFTIPYFPESVRSEDILFFTKDFLVQLVANILCALHVLLQADIFLKFLPWNAVPGFGTLYICSLPFMFLGLLKLKKNTKNNVGVVITLFFLGTGILAAIFTNMANINRINIIFYPLMILVGIGIYEVFTHFKKVRWAVIPLYILMAALFFNAYFNVQSKLIGGYNYKGFTDALVEAQDDDIDKYYITNTTLYNRTEIITMYFHNVDSQEYYGIGEHAGDVPLRDKYVFHSFDEKVVPSDENAVYIAHKDDLTYFDEELFDFKQFGDFYFITCK